MAADTVTPLCTWAEFSAGAFADLARKYVDVTAQTQLLREATRLCERAAGHRLAPFAGVVETHRAQGIDPDELGDSANMPLDLSGTLGRSYAQALGTSTLARHCWLREFAESNPEFWSYTSVAITVVRSFGGSQNFTTAQYVGPEPDSGHVWFNVGQFIPIGSLIRITYGGGFTTMPADLQRAGKLMTANLIVREMQPTAMTHDPQMLLAEAKDICRGYCTK